MIDLSIIIPTYNNLQLLKNSLKSVVKQQNISFEIIIVDDSTNSEIFDFLKTQSTHIKYYKNSPKKGAVRNWNYGLSLAEGTYITVLHHDEFYKNILNQLSIIINGNPTEDVLISKVVVIRPDKSIYSLGNDSWFKNLILNLSPSYLFFQNFIGPVSCVIFKKKHRLFFNENLKWFVDVEWYYRLFRKKKIKYLDEHKVMSYLNHEGKITNNLSIKDEIKKDLKVLLKEYNKKLDILIFLYAHILFKKIKSIVKK